MSDRRTLDHLARAEPHMAAAVDRLAEQDDAAANLPPGSAHRAVADDPLATMGQSLAPMLAHRAMILRELGEDGPGMDAGPS